MDDSLKHLINTATKSRNTIWELTWDYNPSLVDPSYNLPDSAASSPLYEVGINNSYISTSTDVFDSWTGPRRLNGQDFHGPIYNLGTTIPYDGPRHCACSTCESATHPTAKQN